MQIEIHRVTMAGFGLPSFSKTNENGQPLLSHARGELLGPVLPHSTVRLRQLDGNVVESPVILRLGAGWCLTAHGCYSLRFLPDVLPQHYNDPAWQGRGSFQVSGPSWTHPDAVIGLFKTLRQHSQLTSGLPLHEACGYREHFTSALLSNVIAHAQHWATVARAPADGFARTIQVAISANRFHPLALLGELRSAGPLVALHGEASLAPIVSAAGEADMSEAKLKFAVVACGGEVIYATRSEIAGITDEDLERCAAWVQSRIFRAKTKEDQL